MRASIANSAQGVEYYERTPPRDSRGLRWRADIKQTASKPYGRITYPKQSWVALTCRHQAKGFQAVKPTAVGHDWYSRVIDSVPTTGTGTLTTFADVTAAAALRCHWDGPRVECEALNSGSNRGVIGGAGGGQSFQLLVLQVLASTQSFELLVL